MRDGIWNAFGIEHNIGLKMAMCSKRLTQRKRVSE